MTPNETDCRNPFSSLFPDLSSVPSDGLIAIGGELRPEVALAALTSGIFPWTLEADFRDLEGSDEEEEEVFSSEDFADVCLEDDFEDSIRTEEGNVARFGAARWENFDRSSLKTINEARSILGWWAPDPRAIFDLNSIHVPRRVQRMLRNGKFEITFDRAFPEVMLACANVGERRAEGSWICREFFDCYCQLYEDGLAHSVECWLDSSESNIDGSDEFGFGRRLVGGLYGVAINGFFEGESMFSAVSNASKVALFSLLLRLKEKNFALFDLQVLNPHTKSLGGIEISREDYMRRLAEALSAPVQF